MPDSNDSFDENAAIASSPPMAFRRLAYWVSTSLLALMYLAGSVMYLSNQVNAREAFVALGYPAYLVPILGAAKLLGVIAILWRRRVFLTDLAYAGMFYHLLLALSAHIYAADGSFAPATVGLTLVVVSLSYPELGTSEPVPLWEY